MPMTSKTFAPGEKKLIDVLPLEFRSGGYELNSTGTTETQAWKMRNIGVKEEVQSQDRRWIGAHKNVHVWWVLENGYAVGWNENPATGWTFPVKKIHSY